MTNFHKMFHLAGLTAAAAVVIAATQDVSAKSLGGGEPAQAIILYVVMK